MAPALSHQILSLPPPAGSAAPAHTDPLLLPDGLSLAQPGCSANGRWLAGIAAAGADGAALVLLDLATPDSPRLVARHGLAAGDTRHCPVPSDDGTRLACVVTPAGPAGQPAGFHGHGLLQVFRASDGLRTGPSVKAGIQRPVWRADGGTLLHADHHQRLVATHLASHTGSRFIERRAGQLARASDGSLLALARGNRLDLLPLTRDGRPARARQQNLMLETGRIVDLCFVVAATLPDDSDSVRPDTTGQDAATDQQLILAVEDGFSTTALWLADYRPTAESVNITKLLEDYRPAAALLVAHRL